MVQFIAKSPNVEVTGAAILSVVEANPLLRGISLQILAANGIENPTPDAWFKQQSWLDSFKEIVEKSEDVMLRSIGNQIPNQALWPEEIKTIHDGLASIDVAYHMNHRGGEIGHYKYTETDEQKGMMLCDNPYPCEFDIGIIEATAKQFDSEVEIVHDKASCRSDGEESCMYLISW